MNMRTAALTKTGREGRCYELAIQHLLAHGEGTLIHAKVWSITRGMFIGHALVETDTGYIYEPVTDRYFDKAWLYGTYKVREFKRYQFNEALEACAKNRHYGPWDEESLRMPQKGDKTMTPKLKRAYASRRLGMNPISYEAFTNYYGGMNTPKLARDYANREEDPEYKKMFLRLASELERGVRYEPFTNSSGQLCYRKIGMNPRKSRKNPIELKSLLPIAAICGLGWLIYKNRS